LKIIQQVVISRSHSDFIQEVVVILFNKLPWSYSYSKVTVILLFQSYRDLIQIRSYNDLILIQIGSYNNLIQKLLWFYSSVPVILFKIPSNLTPNSWQGNHLQRS